MNIHLYFPTAPEGPAMVGAIMRAVPLMVSRNLATFDPALPADLIWSMSPHVADARPTIRFDKSAPTNLAGSSRKDLLQPRVWVVKRSHFKGADHNSPTLDGRRFYLKYLTDEVPTLIPAPPLSDEALGRLRISPVNGVHYLRHDRTARLAETAQVPWDKRDIDLLFVGTVDYAERGVGEQLVGQHRKKVIADLQERTGTYQIVAGGGRPYAPSEMERMLLRTKIVVSPWGLGESCYRDYEAVMSGCRVLKPRTPYIIETACGMYSKPHDAITFVPPRSMLDVGNLDELLKQEPDPELGLHLRQLRTPERLAEDLHALSRQYLREMSDEK